MILPKIQAINHLDGRFKRFLQMVYDVLAITDATVGDPRPTSRGMRHSAARDI